MKETNPGGLWPPCGCLRPLPDTVELAAGEVLSWADLRCRPDPAEVMDAFVGIGSPDHNIEGPVGANCLLEGASGWRDNGNLSIVDLSRAGSGADQAAANAALDVSGNPVLLCPKVFKFLLHDSKDWDRDTNIKDRQRIEIKTEAQNPNVMSGYGDIMTNRWKFYLPQGISLPIDRGNGIDTGFFHIFQVKAIKGDEAKMPIFTLSISDQALYLHGSGVGRVNQEFIRLGSAAISDVIGRWLEVELTTYTAEKGYIYVRVADAVSGRELLRVGQPFDSWRRGEKPDASGLFREHQQTALPGQANRSKWGLYRSNASQAYPHGFTGAVMYVGDLHLIRRNTEHYVFPDGFDPKKMSRDITWAVRREPWQVPGGTAFQDLELPETVGIAVEAHYILSVPVQWDEGNYDGGTPGEYTVSGRLLPPPEISNPMGICAQQTVRVI